MTTTKDQTYSDDQVKKKLTGTLAEWELRDGWIRRKYKTIGWPYTMMAVNAVGHIAEAANHHPDLSVSYAELHVKLRTHNPDGLTDKDFALAERIEQHLTWLPGEDEPLDGFEVGMKKKWTR